MNNLRDWGFSINGCSRCWLLFPPVCLWFSCSLRSVDLQSHHTRCISSPKNVHRDRRIFHRPLRCHNDYTSYKTPQTFFKTLHMHYELENVKRSKGGESRKLIGATSWNVKPSKLTPIFLLILWAYQWKSISFLGAFFGYKLRTEDLS